MEAPQYDAEQKTLTMVPKETIKVEHLHNIHYGSSAKGDVDLCFSSPNTRYKVFAPENLTLNSHNVSLTLVTDSLYPNLTLNISMKKNEMIHIKWGYQNTSNGKIIPFEVPQDIVATDDLEDCYSCSLANFVRIINWENATDTNSSCMIQFYRMKNDVKVPVFEIQDIILNDYLNVFRTGVYTQY